MDGSSSAPVQGAPTAQKDLTRKVDVDDYDMRKKRRIEEEKKEREKLYFLQ